MKSTKKSKRLSRLRVVKKKVIGIGNPPAIEPPMQPVEQQPKRHNWKKLKHEFALHFCVVLAVHLCSEICQDALINFSQLIT